MQNNKNGNGKRVRTPPITTSTPKPDNKKPKKEAKVTTLLMAGGLAVLAVVVLAVVLITFGRGGKQVADLSPTTQPETVQQVADTTQVLDAIYLSLFTYGLDKNSIKDKTEVATDNEAELKILIDPFHIEAVELKQTISDKLTGLGGLLVADDEAIMASNSKVKLVITFAEPVIIEKPKPNSIAFLIDDCGYSLPLAKKLAALPPYL